ncbi:succinate dehydrogenase, cytochrome b556 subunit [Dyella nitratireducens]|uniref:Succinate dehydrogenase cytochrome b556 subunit n=1 Tax=Dyella nitratireducens TaxID=1849580 RepID=A0ABQ1FJH0_9GAMM|nr:succinate dehydrogenase, cytochrome b556 subunit [Dyella nitratireducens]GGA18400.1 succinate dehydrogenase membrane anchor subunit [Dyella nitratireducens]GLQ44659.1 succinate dehydrogenase membrane anchor subunit [Dyella nitratireducens]
MAETQRPLSPHLQIYKWQVQMVTSILHRATGIALSVGALIFVWWLGALAAGEDAFNQFKICMGSPIGIILLIGWTWSFFYHLCNGIRHLVQDAGAGYAIVQFVRSSWASVIVSLLLTLIVVGYALSAGGAA